MSNKKTLVGVMKKSLFGLIKENPVEDVFSFAERWKHFRDIIINNKKIKVTFDNNLEVLAKSIMHFSEVFVDVDDKDIRSFFINKEDIIIKFLKFLEFWKQKGASHETTKFIIRVLGYI